MNTRKTPAKGNSFILPQDHTTPVQIQLVPETDELLTTITFNNETTITKTKNKSKTSTSSILQIMKEKQPVKDILFNDEQKPSHQMKTRAKDGIHLKKRRFEELEDDVEKVDLTISKELTPKDKKAKIEFPDAELVKINAEVNLVNDEIQQLTNVIPNYDDTFEIFDQCFNKYHSPSSSGNLSEFSLGYRLNSSNSISQGLSPSLQQINIYNYSGTVNIYNQTPLPPVSTPSYDFEAAAKESEREFNSAFGFLDELDINNEFSPFRL